MTRLGRRLQRRGREAGVATLEYVAILPAALFVVALAVQMIIAVQTAQATTSAARQAARAYSLGRDPHAAADGVLSSRMTVTNLQVGPPYHTATITVKIPTLHGLPQWTVTRTAVMP